jgi:Leucine-rich repeat (LRR) protein
MYCRKVSGVSLPVSLSRRNESAQTAEEVRQSDPQYLEALNWINARRRGNERRQTAVDRLMEAKPGQDVTLDNLALTSLPEPLVTRARTAKGISLSGNSLPAIPQSILSFEGLQRLNISGNELTALSPHIAQMQNLRSLDVSHNAIAEIPAAVGALSKLESLNLGDNALRTLPNTIGSLSKLKQLKLSGNMLNDFPPQIAQCASLRELDMSRNHFEVIPPEIGSLPKLHTLKADRNRLTDLEANEDDPDALHNRAIPEGIGRLSHLEQFDVAGNPLTVLPNSFGPFEYTSKRKLEITRQGTNSLLPKVLSKNLRIRIANTPLPRTLAADGRLPELPGAARMPEPVYEALYFKESNSLEAEGPRSPDASPQRPIAQAARAIPELFAAQTMAADQQSFAFPAAQQHNATTPFASMRGPMIPPGHAQAPVPPEQPRSAEPSNVQTAAPAPMGSPLPPSGMPPGGVPTFGMPRTAMPQSAMPPAGISPYGMPPAGTTAPGFSPAAQPAPYGPPGGVAGEPAQMPQPVPMAASLSASAHPFQPMMPASNFPLAGAFTRAAEDPRAAAYAQALQIATSLMQRPAAPQVHAAPIRTAGANESWFDYSRPTVNLAHQYELDKLGFEQVQHNTLEGLSKHYRERLYLQGEHLTQRLEQAKLRPSMGIPGESLGVNVWRVGIMMFRQHVICNLAETVANINRQKKLNDPSQAHLNDDPLQIALVYQTIVSEELQILGLEPLRQHMQNPQFQSMFRHIVSPERTDFVRQGIIGEVHQAEAENEHATLTAFINQQAFWKDYLVSQQTASTAVWRGAYGF